ncbi:MAG: Asp-tRNA(Asn)/Glu-tRNA(Gln) amidotransferase subunit GatC [Pseudomonadota bacterium]
MSVDEKTVKRVAHLARIKVSEEDVPLLQKELNGILSFVEQLSSIDVEGVEPMASGLPIFAELRLRPDEVMTGDYAGDITQNAPDQEDHYFRVPKVVE